LRLDLERAGRGFGSVYRGSLITGECHKMVSSSVLFIKIKIYRCVHEQT
jgi:hypothetical protein